MPFNGGVLPEKCIPYYGDEAEPWDLDRFGEHLEDAAEDLVILHDFFIKKKCEFKALFGSIATLFQTWTF